VPNNKEITIEKTKFSCFGSLLQRFRTRRPNNVRQTSNGWEGNDVHSCECVPAETREVGKRSGERHPLRQRTSSTRLSTRLKREAGRRRNCLASLRECVRQVSVRQIVIFFSTECFLLFGLVYDERYVATTINEPAIVTSENETIYKIMFITGTRSISIAAQ
jgi:hypothetical protein